MFFFFFFSSRRRHTRCSRDWSSDVCSSDLFCARVAAVAPPALRSGHLELPTSHRLPLSWLVEAASPPVVYRAYAEVVPEAERDSARLEALRESVLHYKPAQAIARKQKATGLWGGNLLAPAPSKAYGWTEPGTVFQYRRLLELGWPPSEPGVRKIGRAHV